MTQHLSRADQLRAAKHPVHNDRKLRLGTFSSNLSGGCSMTDIPGVLEAEWSQTMALARMGDEMEFEALVPVGRWRGFGGKTDFNGSGFEAYTWAAGVGASTEKAGLFVTSHVTTVHPVMAAKQAATIDHITGGRLALNVVTGWYTPEIEMFGAPILPHDERYAVAQEWFDIVRDLWTAEEPITREGRYYKIKDALVSPQPLQQPHPVTMNAGGSPAGRAFGAKNCDVLFINVDAGQRDPAGMKAKVDAFKSYAREEFGREVLVWTNAYVVQGDTQAEAERFVEYYVDEHGDWEAADNLVTTMGMQQLSWDKATLDAMKRHFIAGWGGYPAVGTADQIVDTLSSLVDAGLDGVLLSWAQYVDGMARFQAEVHPLLVQAGLR
jgi:dimethylsulfone monooxygenase